MEEELTIVKQEKDEAQNKLTEANELLAANGANSRMPCTRRSVLMHRQKPRSSRARVLL